MKAIGFYQSLPISEPDSFVAFETPVPVPGDRDLLVQVQAISVNPVDFKVRQNSARENRLEQPKIIGWDAAGTVVATGSKVTLFKPGDPVYYAGDITRAGSNAEFQVVDERIVGKKPARLNFAEAAALPLTALTAWEMLFDRMLIEADRDEGKSLLIIGGAGGVGSIAIQLARQIAGLKVIATASRPETIEWCRQMGAHYVINHKNLLPEIKEAGFPVVDFIIDLVDANGYWDTMAELIRPQGRIASITGSSVPVALNKLKNKSVSFSWEFMFTRSMFQTTDMIGQYEILNIISRMIDDGLLKTTIQRVYEGLSAENLKAAHQLLESGKAIGKVVITV
ncbi:zinc-binding alcohol dehydrogenase family protein [Flavihumibacter petaseus]|uniref:Zinc-type alcohol dehydrogenase-like protein n=1 Tax=Flavihumibacter petaseus NBRC 106054 TaxID=1220578 RepID=A0A0E9MV67_9BACT|nr:zinc-binding alcohol dehydrogenase family protein [Flavihumibacter petaseus]GAO41020.1 putative zinc-containing alcohol dehydrogenase [Flavihumibacter petaseus NBRC 106054]